jgi:hypothetical protein
LATFTLAALASIATPVRADPPLTAERLHEQCQTNRPICTAYIAGVIEGLLYANVPQIACMSNTFTYDTIAGVVDDTMAKAFEDEPKLKTELAGLGGVGNSLLPIGLQAGEAEQQTGRPQKMKKLIICCLLTAIATPAGAAGLTVEGVHGTCKQRDKEKQ